MSGNQETKLNNLVEWSKQQGSSIDSRVVFKYSEASGVHAIVNDDVQESFSLIQVSKNILITPDYATDYFGVKENDPTNINNSWLQLFVAKLKFDTNEPTILTTDGVNCSEKWKHYIDYLPETLNNPFWWNEDEKSLLKGTDAGILLNRQYQSLLQEWQSLITVICQKFPNWATIGNTELAKLQGLTTSKHKLNTVTSWLSFPAYLWAANIFTSRAFPYFIINDHVKDLNQACLIPILDLLNHKHTAKVGWSYVDHQVNFVPKQSLKSGDELFNNYGDKSNTGLLLGYGFVLENNEFDETFVTLKVDESQITDAKQLGIKLPEGASSIGINFSITNNDCLPENLVNFFAFLVQLKSEKAMITLRMKLDGLTQLASIINQKVEFYKTQGKINTSMASKVSPSVIKVVKSYMLCQKKLFQSCFEEIGKLEKSLLKKHKPLSFKTVLKNDKPFMNSLLLTIGVSSYDTLVKQKIVDQVFLLWVVRSVNLFNDGEKSSVKPPQFIVDEFKQVAKSIVVTKEDVLEYHPLYKTFFPSLPQKIPEIYGHGEWGIKQFIIAGTVADRVCYTRSANNELFLLERKAV
ncbi:protein-lysine N-methyltransferase [Saccharomycopsis crataegensis]|uniref:Protein-lysine N-methyltransferase n=1 Tax=Saccharomycopsis crataegensis TaxID=43959 RepID=A0AAV5QIV7_9ASCO|nr:protein-lysine N-methyltransferase [Saccharomycopsis crataegensis]